MSRPRPALLACTCAVFVLAAALPAAARVPQEPAPPAYAYHGAAAAIANDGQFPTFTLSSAGAFQAGAVLVTAANATAGSATLFGRTYALAARPSGMAAFVAVDTYDRPGPTTLTVTLSDAEGVPYTTAVPFLVKATHWTVDYIDLPPSVGGLLDPGIAEAEQVKLAQIYSGFTPIQWRLPWIVPDQGPISSYMGEQRSFNGGPVGGHHGGTDIALDAGTPIHATNDGTVVLAEALAERGNMVILDHGGGVFSGYGHMERFAVKVGDHVTQGEVIGYVGSTGLSTGPHLHWELSVDGVLVDGLRWLDGTQGF